MIIRRQWVGSARVLQVLNLIGPEGPIAPGGTPGRNPGEEPRGGNPGRNLRKETLGRAGSIRPTGPTAPQHHRPHSTTAPQAPQHHSTSGPIATVHSVLTASIHLHHPSHCPPPFNFHIKHSKHKRKTMRN